MSSIYNIVVKSEGSDISKEVEVISFESCYKINEISRAELRLSDGDPAKETFELSENSKLKPGKKIEVLAGYKKGQEKTLFKGIITGLEIGRGLDDNFYLELVLHSDSIKMVDQPITQMFPEKTKDGDIISKLMGDAGVTAGAVADSKIEHSQFIQMNQSPWKCVLQRCAANGFLFVTTPDESKVIDPAKDKGAEIEVGIASSGVEHFRLQVDTSGQIKGVKASAWDIKDQAVLSPVEGKGAKLYKVADSDKVIGRPAWEVEMNTGFTKDAVGGWANAQASYRNIDLIKGSITFHVSPDNKMDTVLVGDSLKLEGFGKNFNGKHFVTGVEHKIDVTGWRARVRVGLPLSKTIKHEEVKDSVYPVNGLCVGTVAKYKDDPQQFLRIPVIIPGLTGGKEIWARLLTPFGSVEEGLFLPPRENDEVVIGFWQGDWSQPVILGSVHNPKNKPPFPYDEENLKRGIFLKESELSITFDEEEKHIKTAAGEKVDLTISTENGILNKNDKATLDITAGIALSSEDFKVETTKGDAEFTVKSKCKITAKSGTDIV